MAEPLTSDDIPEIEAALQRLESDTPPNFVGAAFQLPLLEHELDRLRREDRA